jgi:hypothetical protein
MSQCENPICYSRCNEATYVAVVCLKRFFLNCFCVGRVPDPTPHFLPTSFLFVNLVAMGPVHLSPVTWPQALRSNLLEISMSSAMKGETGLATGLTTLGALHPFIRAWKSGHRNLCQGPIRFLLLYRGSSPFTHCATSPGTHCATSAGV